MQKIQDAIKAIIHELYQIDFTPEISPAPKPELGEYCVNIFGLVKIAWKAPNIISEEVTKKLAENTEIFRSTSATGGYVNFFLTDSVWMEIFSTLSQPANQPTSQKTIIVDYIGMNVGKPPHIGHICTPLLGQSVINTLKYLWYRVIGDSHLGDWWSLFGKLIVGYKKYGNSESLEEDAINHLLEVYIKINADIEIDNGIEQECRDAFRHLSHGDKNYTDLWVKFTTATIATTKSMLQMMHIHQDYDIGESFYEGLPLPKLWDQPELVYDMNRIVEELIEKWIATQNEDGSVGVVFPEETKIPSTILRKKDGTNLYLTSDLCAIKYRITNGWNPIKILYFVDVRQQLHLKQAFWIARQAWDMESIELSHTYNGAIVLPEWAMSTRKWNIIRLDALVDEGFVRVKKILEDKERNLSEKDIREITIGAIKYSYLTQDRERDIIFTWDKALNFEWHSGPYIQYAYVRARKISDASDIRHISDRKYPAWEEQDFSQARNDKNFELWTLNFELSQSDKSLIQMLQRFDAAIENTAKTYKPHHLALYAYDLAVGFNSFYVHTPKILEEKNETLKQIRLSLVTHTADTLKQAFALLAIEMPSEM